MQDLPRQTGASGDAELKDRIEHPDSGVIDQAGVAKSLDLDGPLRPGQLIGQHS
jgi:hypothetical protein